MLSIRENLLETIKGGNPDRFVNQYEFLETLVGNPSGTRYPRVTMGGEPVVNGWGVTSSWPDGLPGPFPVHDDEHKVVRDITKWRDVVKAPDISYDDAAWQAAHDASEAANRSEKFASISMAPGIFEQLHYLMGMDDCLANFYLEPEYMKEMIDFIVDYELRWGAELIKHFKPDALFHHDDWGSQISSFISPEMFTEFLLPAYKKVYGFHKENGIELIVHHSDSYAANLVPQMIEMGIDIFQGCLDTNNVPELVKKFGGKISFMGDLNNGKLDIPNWTPELIRDAVEKACRANGKLYYIPCLTMGGPSSTYPGVYDAVTEEIKRMSSIMF